MAAVATAVAMEDMAGTKRYKSAAYLIKNTSKAVLLNEENMLLLYC